MELKDKTILITGSTDRVGRVVAQRLGAAGARVLVHGRDATRGKAVVTEIEAAGGKAELLVADLSSLAEVRRLAEAVRARTDRLDILINNAGIGTAGQGAKRQVSADGYELRFAVNYLAGFLLTSELLPLLKASMPARIVNVASAGQQAIDFSDVMLTRSYDGVRAYCQSKLAQILFTVDLAEQLKGTGVTVNALPPGELHEHHHGPAGRRNAVELGRDRRRRYPQPRHFDRARRKRRPLFRWPAGIPCRRSGL